MFPSMSPHHSASDRPPGGDREKIPGHVISRQGLDAGLHGNETLDRRREGLDGFGPDR